MARILFLALSPIVLAACFNPSMNIDERSALEQELTRTAILRAVDKLAVPNDVLSGTWRIEVSAPDLRDESWIRSCLQRRLAALGVNVSADENAPLPVVEARTVFAGSDIDNFYAGLPLPGSGGKAISFYQSVTERGRARIGLTFWSADGELVAQTPSLEASAHYKDIFVLTIFGPLGSSDVENVEVYQRWLETGEDTWHGLKDTGEQIDRVEKEERNR
jgi:hypothetical protein